tara:strand:- start:6250 stop:7437 length:1188 start_codon:yes stop_codon:yes gene_type:complete
MSEEVKKEGDFKLKKPKAKQLGKIESEVVKVDLTKKEEPIKVDLTKKEEDAVQKQSTNDSDVTVEGSENSSNSEKVVEEVRDSEEKKEVVIQEISEEEIKEEVIETKQELQSAVEETKQTGKPLPENIEKLVSFMEETGGTIEDYVRLNADYSKVDENVLLREYYKQSKPYLNHEEVSLLMEDNFKYDQEIDDERDIRRKKLAFKEEVAKAKNFLEQTKSKYYDEIKLRPSVTQEQKKAMDFFNRYNEEQNTRAKQHENFKDQTKEFFSNDFKGFDFNLGKKKFRYGLQNPSQVADVQSDINNVVGKFLDKKGNVTDTSGYHKAMYAAMNADKLASHFYEQGKADATKDIVSSSKNPSTGEPRQAPENVYINGLKVKAISGIDSSKLKIKTRKFN